MSPFSFGFENSGGSRLRFWWWSDLHSLADFHLSCCKIAAVLLHLSWLLFILYAWLWCRLKLIFLVAINMTNCCHHQRVMQSLDVYWRPGLFLILIWCTGKVSLAIWQGQIINWKAMGDLKIPHTHTPPTM